MSGPIGCVFCAIIAGDAPASIVAESGSAVMIEPLGPHVPGHLLVIPRRHVEDATTDPQLTGAMFTQATHMLGKRQGNLLTSVGPLATQTVPHLHVHVIPRTERDGLHPDWPWLRDLFRRRE